VKIFRSFDSVPRDFGPCALTIGNFDGVHLGHRRILERLVELAAERGWKPSLLTFDPHPTRVVAPERTPPLLMSPERRVELMAKEGLEQAFILPFGPEVARLSPEEFVSEILATRLQARAVVVGRNFHFGYRQAGDAAALQALGRRYGFETEAIPAETCRGRTVSSSGVRNLIRSGGASLAARFLGRPFALEGEVAAGRGIGSKLVVPTLNLETSDELIPAQGVYATRTADLDSARCWNSITNIGQRPTFEHDGRTTIETFLLDPFDGEAPCRIRVEFLWRVRDERKFESAEALKARVLRDVRAVQRGFRRVQFRTYG
jgi:riboflavin kinase / FMN adenylyltransferase